MTNYHELYRALDRAYQDAKNQAEQHELLMLEKPPYGWSQEKHALYHSEARNRALSAANYLFVRMMQINPD